MSLFSLKKSLIEISHLCYANKMVSATDGNLSIRISENEVLTTGTKTVKGKITQEDLVVVSMDGKKMSGKKNPSTELDMHLTIYKSRSDVNAVVHCHPIYATAFALARIPLDQCLIPEVIAGLGSIPLAEYATPGTEELSDSLKPFLKNSSAILMANHGAVTFGSDIFDAYYKMEKLEHFAQTAFLANQLGGAKPLTSSQLSSLKNVIESKGDKFSGDCNPV